MGENYIVQLTNKLYKKSQEKGLKMDKDLLELYVLLTLTKGVDTTNEDVHNAWAIWQNRIDQTHKSLRSFKALSKDVQLFDTPYRDLIIECANFLEF